MTFTARRRFVELGAAARQQETTQGEQCEVWKAPAPRYTRGVQAKFAFNAGSASKGAVLDNY